MFPNYYKEFVPLFLRKFEVFVYMKKLSLLLCFVLTSTIGLLAQVNLWQSADLSEVTSARTNLTRYSQATDYGLFKVSEADLRAEFAAAPHELDVSASNSYTIISFPMPDGSVRNFRVVAFDMLEPRLARKFPHIRTYRGVDIESGAKLFVNFTTDQVFGVIREKGHTYYIDPYHHLGSTYYVSYDIRNAVGEGGGFQCDEHKLEDNEVVTTGNDIDHQHVHPTFSGARGQAIKLNTFRLAVSATYPFTNYYGGTVQGALDGITTLVTRINEVFERDLAIRMILVNDNDKVIFDNPDDDPFKDIPNGDQAAFLLPNNALLNSEIGASNYDIGHVFNMKANATVGQGIASVGGVCNTNTKGRGASARPQPVGDAFAIAIISHEMGHQFGARHTMYHCQNVEPGNGFEPGSGTTIMSYAGICSPEANIVPTAEDYFHGNSVEVIRSFASSRNCRTEVDLGNSNPDASLDYPAVTYIPLSTPFRLEGTATDMEAPEALTYCWEQMDAGNRNDYENNPWDISEPIGNEALFRSWPPTPEPYRYLPLLSVVVNSSNYQWEILPDYAREMTFRMTVRDNAAENGGTDFAEMKIQVIDNSEFGLFELTRFNTRDTIYAGGYEEVTWNVAGTDKAPISTDLVDILLSIDGGKTFPIMLKENTANDGSAFVAVPDTFIPDSLPNRFRVMVRSVDNIFYNVSRRSGQLLNDSIPAISLAYDDSQYNVCAPDMIDIDITPFAINGYDAGDVSFSLEGSVPDGTIATFSQADVSLDQTTTLTLDFSEVEQGGIFEAEIVATAPNAATIRRKVDLNIITANYGDIAAVSPANGETNVGLIPVFEWNTAADADEYMFELSDQPDFSNIVLTVDEITDGTLDPGQQVDAGKIYYWRLKPSNACGATDINRVFTFSTKSITCDEYTYSGDIVTIPTNTGTFAEEMVIDIGSPKEVSEINVTKVEGRHFDMGDLKLSLINPEGTAAVLLLRQCDNVGAAIDMGFDDDAAGVIPNCLNFEDGIRFEPEEPLSVMNGDISGTQYKLLVEDIQAGFGGEITSWAFEICANAEFESPLVVNADTLNVAIQEVRTVGTDKIELTHSQYGAGDITLTITELPQRGEIRLNGTALAIGSQMTMQDIIDGAFAYAHTGSADYLDRFSFIATTPDGGYVAAPSILVYIGNVATFEPLPANATLSIFPNPTTADLTVVLKGEGIAIDAVRIYSIEGKLIQQADAIESVQTVLPTASLQAGMYLLEVRAGNYTEMLKFIKR